MAQRAATETADLAPIQNAARAADARGGGTDETDVPMTIGEVARAFGITLRALRFYESKRLIAPLRRGSNRLYGASDRERLALVLTGRRLGFTLAEIKELVERPDGRNLHLTREQCLEQINMLERQKRSIELALGELRQIYTSFYRSRFEDRRPC